MSEQADLTEKVKTRPPKLAVPMLDVAFFRGEEQKDRQQDPEKGPVSEQGPSEVARRRLVVSEEECTSYELPMKTTTRLMGGGAKAKHVDLEAPIRPSSIRGHLRFWWRALFAPCFATPQALFKAEQALWGGASGSSNGEGRRSPVEIKVLLENKSEIENKKTSAEDNLRDPRKLSRAEKTVRESEAYATWPFHQGDGGETLAEGIEFQLQVYIPRTIDDQGAGLTASPEKQVLRSLRAWILFGGVGGRTRRGCGHLALRAPVIRRSFEEDLEEQALEAWLPRAATREEFVRLLGDHLFVATDWDKDTPVLRGAALLCTKGNKSSMDAWYDALKWLRDFRQGRAPKGQGNATYPKKHARNHGQGPRPGRSNWPEPDKLRVLTRRHSREHPPRPEIQTKQPNWPRASFGLPFKTDRWSGGGEPEPYALGWMRDGDHEPRQRLASPLILGPMPLANGNFVPFALWLTRSFPEGASLGVVSRDTLRYKCAFDIMVAEGDEAMLEWLDTPEVAAAPQGQKMKTAFTEWLKKKNVQEVK